jgi:flagellar FliL protein
VSSDAIIDAVPAQVAVRKKPRAGKKIMLVASAAGLLLLAIGGVGSYFLLKGDHEEEVATAPSADADTASYIEVPPLVVNLRSGDGQARFLKLRFIIVPANAAKTEEVKAKLPVILDALQPFLRELRPDDLSGSAAVFRIKEEMMVRTTQALGAGSIRDILIQDLVQQ